MPQFGTLSTTADFPTTGGGTTILSGTGAPSGNVGDFYMDTAAKVLFGPKSATGVDTYVQDPAIPPSMPNNGPGNWTWGLKVRFLAPVTVTALRYYRASSATVPQRTLTLYRAGVSVATVTSPGESGSGWKTIPLGTPVNADTAADYVTAYHAANDYYPETTGAPASYAPTYVTNLGACYGVGVGFPANDVPGNIYFADLVFQSPWPIALKSA